MKKERRKSEEAVHQWLVADKTERGRRKGRKE